MTNERIPTISKKELLKRLADIPDDAEISFSGLSFIRFDQTLREPPRFQAVFDPHVFRTAEGVVVVDNPE